MKNYTYGLALALFFAIASSVGAFQLGDLEGSWKGARTETVNGAGSYSSAKMVCKMRADGGLAITETGTSKWVGGSYVCKHAFKDGGKYSSVFTYHGLILSTSSGKWSKSGSSISISGTQRSGGSGSTPFSGTLTLMSKDKVIYKGKSGAITVRISASR